MKNYLFLAFIIAYAACTTKPHRVVLTIIDRENHVVVKNITITPDSVFLFKDTMTDAQKVIVNKFLAADSITFTIGCAYDFFGDGLIMSSTDIAFYKKQNDSTVKYAAAKLSMDLKDSTHLNFPSRIDFDYNDDVTNIFNPAIVAEITHVSAAHPIDRPNFKAVFVNANTGDTTGLNGFLGVVKTAAKSKQDKLK